MRRVLPSLVAAALVLAACTGTEPDDGPTELFTVSPTVTADPSPTTAGPTPSEPTGSADPTPAEASTEIDVSVIPDEITLDYATAVVNTLYAIYAQEALAPVLEADTNPLGAIPESANAVVEAIAEGETRRSMMDELSAFATGELSPDGLLGEPIGLRLQGVQLQYASSECIIVLGRTDRTGIQLDGVVAEALSALALSPASGDAVENSTAWVLIDNLSNSSDEGRLPDDVMIDADLGDYEGFLQHSCKEEDRGEG